MLHDWDAGQNQNIKTGNEYFYRVEEPAPVVARSNA